MFFNSPSLPSAAGSSSVLHESQVVEQGLHVDFAVEGHLLAAVEQPCRVHRVLGQVDIAFDIGDDKDVACYLVAFESNIVDVAHTGAQPVAGELQGHWQLAVFSVEREVGYGHCQAVVLAYSDVDIAVGIIGERIGPQGFHRASLEGEGKQVFLVVVAAAAHAQQDYGKRHE